MKRGLILFLIFFICGTSSYAQESEISNTTQEQKEINLDIGTPFKSYNLEKPDYRNNPQKSTDDEDDMPFDFVASPLKLLKQYMNDSY